MRAGEWWGGRRSHTRSSGGGAWLVDEVECGGYCSRWQRGAASWTSCAAWAPVPAVVVECALGVDCSKVGVCRWRSCLGGGLRGCWEPTHVQHNALQAMAAALPWRCHAARWRSSIALSVAWRMPGLGRRSLPQPSHGMHACNPGGVVCPSGPVGGRIIVMRRLRRFPAVTSAWAVLRWVVSGV